MNMQMHNQRLDFHSSRGLSLIETMISMVLGLLLVGGLSSIYFSSKGTDKMRQAISETEANARMAFASLNQVIQHAGYRSIYTIPFDKPFLSQTDGLPQLKNTRCRKGGSLLKSATTHPYTQDGVNTSDTLTSIYLADNPDDDTNVISRARVFTDCSGTPVSEECSADTEKGMLNPADAKIYNSYYVSNGTLMCLGSLNVDGKAVSLADNIENMQIRYGVIKNNQTSYKTATEVETNQEWQNVVSVQIGLLISSKGNVLQVADNTRKQGPYQVLDQSVSVAGLDKRKLHRVYSTTIFLANRSNNRSNK